MIVMYNRETGVVEAAAEVADVEGYIATLTKLNRPFVVTDDKMAKPLHYYKVVEGALEEIPDVLGGRPNPDPVQVRKSVKFKKLPVGTMVSLNGEQHGPIDDGLLDFTPTAVGSYNFQFTCDGYVGRGFSLEVVARD